MAAETNLVQSESSSGETLSSELLGNRMQVEHSLLDHVNAVLGVHRGQFFSGKRLLGGLDHTLSVIITQLDARADHGTAKPLTQNLSAGRGTRNTRGISRLRANRMQFEFSFD